MMHGDTSAQNWHILHGDYMTLYKNMVSYELLLHGDNMTWYQDLLKDIFLHNQDLSHDNITQEKPINCNQMQICNKSTWIIY